jgi:hypothetical protein
MLRSCCVGWVARQHRHARNDTLRICHKLTKSKHQRHQGNRSRHIEEGSHSESDRTTIDPFDLFKLVELATASGRFCVCICRTPKQRVRKSGKRQREKSRKNVNGSNILLLNTTAEPGVQRQTSTREVQKNVNGANILLLNTTAEPGVQRLSSVASVSAAWRYSSCLFRLIP